MDFPKLQDGQHAVVVVERDTGIVLRLDGKWHTGDGAVWRIFDTLTDARDFSVVEVAAHPSFECTIFDSQHRLIQTFRNEE